MKCTHPTSDISSVTQFKGSSAQSDKHQNDEKSGLLMSRNEEVPIYLSVEAVYLSSYGR